MTPRQFDVRHLALPEAEAEPVSLVTESDGADDLAGDDMADDDELAEAAL